jgi:hypothetical protein
MRPAPHPANNAARATGKENRRAPCVIVRVETVETTLSVPPAGREAGSLAIQSSHKWVHFL